MPSSLTQLFFSGRSSYKIQEDGVAKRIARSKSFTLSTKYKHSQDPTEVMNLFYPERKRIIAHWAFKRLVFCLLFGKYENVKNPGTSFLSQIPKIFPIS